jgi:acetylornithine/succinyldiaminopimelate/putrescine aminotransferase
MSVVEPYDYEFVSGKGSRLLDKAGKSYLDFWGDEGISAFGNGTDNMVGVVIQDHLDKNGLIHCPKMFHEPIREKLAEELVRISGIDGQVVYSNSGTEANEAMIKLARLYWYKKGEPYRFNIAVKRGNFHGRTGFSLAASDSADSPYHKLGFGPMPVGFYTFDTMDELYRLSKLPGGLAGVMMATVLGNNCIEIYDETFFEQLKTFREDTGTLILLDEVQVSMGRTGKYMGYQNYNDFRPDICSIGKGIAAGFPLAATVARQEVAEAFTPGAHFNTFGGNTLACHVSLNVIKYLDGHLDEIFEKGRYMRQELSRLPFISGVVGLGVHNVFQINPKYFNLFDGFEFCRKASEKGLLIVTHRKYGQIRFTPPITVSKEEIDQAIAILKETFTEIMNEDM